MTERPLLPPARAPDAHKHRLGHVLVAAGGLEGVGAPRLAARAALRVGAGLVTVLAPDEAMAAHAARGPDALMLRRVDDGAGLAGALAGGKAPATLVIGPALGLDGRAGGMVAAALRLTAPLVLDADALTLIARDADLGALLASRAAPTVLTPHAGEFARLAPDLAAEMAAARTEAGRPTAARALAARLRAIVVLKGPGTVIADPDGRVRVNPTGSAALATAGSGDVLAGAIAGLMAQGMPAFEAAAAGAYWHGEAGSRLGAGLIADDLPEELGRLRREAEGDPAS